MKKIIALILIGMLFLVGCSVKQQADTQMGAGCGIQARVVDLRSQDQDESRHTRLGCGPRIRSLPQLLSDNQEDNLL